jgi:mevalonate kinase
MNNFEKSMAEVFDVTPTVVEETKKEVLPVVKPETDNKQQELQQDLTDAYQQSKENLQGIIDQGKEAMEEILNIAKAGQHPRAFEVYSGLLKNMTEANDRLLKIQKEMRDMEGIKKEASSTNIDKAIFVGSTSELSKLLKGKKE